MKKNNPSSPKKSFLSEQQTFAKAEVQPKYCWLSLFIFFLIMVLVFALTFNGPGRHLSQLLAARIDAGTREISRWLLAAHVDPAFHSLITQGICPGVGSVLTFLPTIAVLFFLLSLLEESGYLHRISGILHKPMSRLGLSGYSMVPFMLGFGCAVPAVLAAGSLPSRSGKTLTILTVPLMSCSARLPLYGLFTAAFFPQNPWPVIAAVYAVGILTALGICGLLQHRFQENVPSVPPDLPKLHLPSLPRVLRHVAKNSWGFVKKIFTVLFVASIIIWFLQNYDLRFAMVSHSSQSILAALGKSVAPVLTPLGFGHWIAATALLAGISAKEGIVSTLAILSGAAGSSSAFLLPPQVFSPLSAFVFMVFCLLYLPCIATIAAMRKELGSRLVCKAVFLQLLLAWIICFLLFQGGSFLSGLL